MTVVAKGKEFRGASLESKLWADFDSSARRIGASRAKVLAELMDGFVKIADRLDPWPDYGVPFRLVPAGDSTFDELVMDAMVSAQDSLRQILECQSEADHFRQGRPGAPPAAFGEEPPSLEAARNNVFHAFRVHPAGRLPIGGLEAVLNGVPGQIEPFTNSIDQGLFLTTGGEPTGDRRVYELAIRAWSMAIWYAAEVARVMYSRSGLSTS